MNEALRITIAIVGFLSIIYLLIGMYLYLANHTLLRRSWVTDPFYKPPYWLIVAICVLVWPKVEYKEAKEKLRNEQKAQQHNLSSNVSRGGYETPERTSGGSRLYLRQSVDESHRERVASYFDPFEYAARDEGFSVALQELVGDDDSDRDRELELPSTERSVPFDWGTPYETPSPVETPSAAPLKEESCGSSQSDYGMGSDYSGPSGSDPCSSSYDSGSSSGGGE